LFGGSTDKKLVPSLKLEGLSITPNLSEQLLWERELLGLYLSHNPLETYEPVLSKLGKPINSISRDLDGRVITIGGCVNQCREISTKNGSKMAFVILGDGLGEIEVVVFPNLYSQTAGIWQRDNFIVAKGKVDFSRSEEPKLLLEDATHIKEDGVKDFKKTSVNRTRTSTLNLKQRLYIRLEDSQNQPLLITLKEKLDGHHGETEVVLVTGESSKKQIIKLPQTININEQSLRELASIFGSTNVVVR
jgi:DNA polymerase-3 subunit alpha